MRPYLATFLASLVLLGATLVPAIAGKSAAPQAASVACTSALIQGKRECIARGQLCTHTRRANRDYRLYGLSCSQRDRDGRHHLQ
ncbi:MAG: hypothetical protein ACXVRH_06585 [Thermoleophilaceae bacterium]